MKTLTVAEMKWDDRNFPHQDYPKSGSRAGLLLNLLMSNPGHSVDTSELREEFGDSLFSRAVETLRDMYGMDIRSTKPRSRKLILAGEWIGVHYTDYCAAAFKAGEK